MDTIHQEAEKLSLTHLKLKFADQALGGNGDGHVIADKLKTLRDAGTAYHQMAAQINVLTGTTITHETIRRWWMQLNGQDPRPSVPRPGAPRRKGLGRKTAERKTTERKNPGR